MCNKCFPLALGLCYLFFLGWSVWQKHRCSMESCSFSRTLITWSPVWRHCARKPSHPGYEHEWWDFSHCSSPSFLFLFFIPFLSNPQHSFRLISGSSQRILLVLSLFLHAFWKNDKSESILRLLQWQIKMFLIWGGSKFLLCKKIRMFATYIFYFPTDFSETWKNYCLPEKLITIQEFFGIVS